jgi:hypothetical protein
MDRPFWLFLWTNITRTFASVLKFETMKRNQGKKELIIADPLQLSPVLGFVLPLARQQCQLARETRR